MNATFYARPLIALTAALALGAAGGGVVPGLTLPAIFSAAAAAACVGAQILRRQPGRFSPLALFVLLGYLSLQPWLVPDLPPEHVMNLADGTKRCFTATVVSTPQPSGHRTRCIVSLESTTPAGAAARPVIGRVRLTLFDAPRMLRRGDRIRFYGRMRPFHNFNNPGGFDYRRYMAFQQICVSSWCNGKQVERLEPRARSSPLERFRERTAALIDAAANGDANAVLHALVLGERRRIQPQLNAAFQRTGVSHLLAISGLHIGIIAGAAFFLLRQVFARFEPLLWRASVRQHAALWAFLPALLYGLIAGMSPSTQRALIMVGVFLATFFLRKEHDLVNTVAVAALLILIAHPPALFSISFQLSFAAVLAIVLGMRVLLPGSGSPGRERPLWQRLADKALRFVAVSFFATIGTLPLIMAHFNQISLIGIAANCLFVPWIGFCAVPTALAATFVQPISPAIGQLLMQGAAAMLNCCLPVLQWLADRPFAATDTVALSGLEIVCYYLIFGLILARLQFRSGYAPKPVDGNPSDAAAWETLSSSMGRRAAAGLIIALLVMGGDILYWVHQRWLCEDLRITVLDVGQGSAALVEMPRGRCMLIDGGGFSDNSAFDVGARIVAPYLRRRKIRTVDTLLLSHPNSDHLNGLLYIAENFRIGRLWSNGQPADTRGYRRLLDIVARRQIPHPVYGDVPRCRRSHGLTVELLHPPADFLDGVGTGRSADLNNNSVVVKLAFGSTSVLFPGDIEAEAEAELIAAAGKRLQSDVLVVPHHGSATSSTDGWVDAVAPKLAVISARERYRRKIPHPDVLQRYTERGIRLLRTDRQGAVRLHSDGRRIETVWERDHRIESAIGRLPLAEYWYKGVKQ